MKCEQFISGFPIHIYQMKAAFLLCLSSFAMIISPLAAQEYTLDFADRAPAGVSYTSSRVVTTSQSMHLTQGDRVLKDEKHEFRIDYNGVERVLEVNGETKSFSVTVNKLTKTENDTTQEILPKGTVVSVKSVSGKPSFTLEDKPVAGDVAAVLRFVIPAGSGGPHDSAVFNVQGKKKVGDHWPLDSAAAATEFGQGAVLTADAIQGTAMLKSVEKAPGDELLLIETQLKGSPKIPLGDKLTLDDSTLNVLMTIKLPSNSKALIPWATTKLDLVTTAHGDGGPNGPIKLSLKMSQTDEQAIVAEAK